MPANHSFDIVSEINFQETDNAVNQAIKEINQRYDLKDSNTIIELNKKEKQIVITTKDDYSRKQTIDILQSKFIKRNIALKAMKYQEPESAASGRLKQIINLQNGISKENGKLIIKLIKESRLKINSQIQDEQVRVSASKIDDLQLIIKLIKEADFNFPVQFTNYK
ncbi:MAG: YajQ family cyclic di-GMP-binding protein [Ignavibacteria bacterium]|nr:YajQ family cyclic di-GMP-binding protein [Ignavibacteria bacterium]